MPDTITAPSVATEIRRQEVYFTCRNLSAVIDSRAIVRALRGLAGVEYVETITGGYAIGVVNSDFFPVDVVAKTAARRLERMLSGDPEVEIDVRVRTDGNYLFIDTDFRHTEQKLLDELRKLGLFELRFTANGYSILCRTRGDRDARLFRRIAAVINGFYNGVPVRPALKYERVVNDDRQAFFAWVLNQRLDDEQLKALRQEIDQIDGLGDFSFSKNGHGLIGTAVNSCFSLECLALEVLLVTVEFFENLVDDEPESAATPAPKKRRRSRRSRRTADAIGAAAVKGANGIDPFDRP